MKTHLSLSVSILIILPSTLFKMRFTYLLSIHPWSGQRAQGPRLGRNRWCWISVSIILHLIAIMSSCLLGTCFAQVHGVKLSNLLSINTPLDHGSTCAWCQAIFLPKKWGGMADPLALSLSLSPSVLIILVHTWIWGLTCVNMILNYYRVPTIFESQGKLRKSCS